MCFKIFGKSAHAAQCEKSRVLNKVLNLFFDIDYLENICRIIKVLLQYEPIKEQKFKICVEKSLNKSSLYEHR